MNQNPKHRRPSSYRQMRAVDLWLGGGCKSKARAILGAGYSKSIAHQPHKVFDSPAVLDELDKRGYNPNGTRFPMQAIDLGETPPPEPPLAIDFSKASNEWLQELKERLREAPGADPFAKTEETISLTSTTASIATDPEQNINW